MRLRNWLLAGTSLGILALAPIGFANADDATLTAAYEAYVAAQNSGDSAAVDTAKQVLTEECITAGFASLDECIAALAAGNTAPSVEAVAPSSEPAPPVESVEPPASSEAPPPPPSSEAPPPPASSEAPPPPPPSSEAPAPSSEAPPPPASSEAPAPVDAPQQAAPSSQEAAPATESSSEAAPAAEVDVLAQLQAAVARYNEGIADLVSGKAEGQSKIEEAKAQIDSICQGAGFTDSTACLAQFGLELAPLPPTAVEPTSELPISELPGADEKVDETAVEVLPPSVKPEEAAPILDSTKDERTRRNRPGDKNTSSEPPPPPAEPATPPPSNDKSAQDDITPPPAEQQSTQTEQGEKIVDFKFEQPTAPKDNENVKVVDKVNTGIIFQINFQLVISDPEQERDRYYDRDRDQIEYETLSRGRTRETVTRPNGVKIVTIRNRNGDILKRSKILPNGREIILAAYDPDEQQNNDLIEWRDPGRDLPPLRLTIPAREYILDADTADEDEVENFLDQPPVERVRRIYSIDEVKRSARIRDSVRRLEVGGLTFDSGRATISRDQVASLSKVANAMLKLLDRDPGEVFLIEGHTDAVGSDVSNLALSDSRAATVARILSDFYEIPPENLVTQGYGERYLKVKTEAAERLNRRVTIKRITPLISYASK